MPKDLAKTTKAGFLSGIATSLPVGLYLLYSQLGAINDSVTKMTAALADLSTKIERITVQTEYIGRDITNIRAIVSKIHTNGEEKVN